MEFKLVKGDITKSKSDIIVNSLGTFTWLYGDVCKSIIYKTKSSELVDIIDNNHNERNVCDMFVTDSYGLPSKKIIHIVAPYRYLDDDNLTELKRAYELVLNKAIQLKVKSIVIPFIGTGANGYTRNDVFEAVTSLISKYYDLYTDIFVQLIIFIGKPIYNDRSATLKELVKKEGTITDNVPENIEIKNEIHKKDFVNDDNLNKLFKHLEINKIFSNYDIFEIEDPGEKDENETLFYHVLQGIMMQNNISSSDLYAQDKDILNGCVSNPYNKLSRIKIGKYKLKKDDVYNYAIASKANVTQSLLLMASAGFCFDSDDMKDVIFHKCLENGKLPKNILDFEDLLSKYDKGYTNVSRLR